MDKGDIAGYIKLTDNIIDKVDELEKIEKPKGKKLTKEEI